MMKGVLAFKEQLEFVLRIARPNAFDWGRTKLPFFFWKLAALTRGFGFMNSQPKPKF